MHINESLTKARMMYLILEGLSDEYESMVFAAERDHETSLLKSGLLCAKSTQIASRAVAA